MQAAQVPEDRLRMGLVRTFAAEESAILGYHKDPLYNAGLFMNGEAIRRDCVEKMRRFDVRPQEPTLTTANFSGRSEEHTSELQSLMRISYAVFCLNTKRKTNYNINNNYAS